MTAPPFEHIAPARLLDAVAGDRAAFAQLGRMFLDSTPGVHANIQRALAAGARADVRALCHQLRSSAAIIGADGLNAELGRIEQLARYGGDLPAPHEAAALATLVAQVQQELTIALVQHG